MASLRKRIADSDAFNDAVAAVIERYIRFVHRSSRWERLGYDVLDDLVSSGEPVIVVLWHQRLLLSPYSFPLDLAPICSLTSAGRAGRLAGRLQKRFGMSTIAMSSHITRMVYAGVGIGGENSVGICHCTFRCRVSTIVHAGDARADEI